jgi:hypothetical protein
MNGVDQSNQLRKNFTAHRPYERRVWRPLWYYILDVCAVNGYLIWRGNTRDQNKRGQRLYRDSLINDLLNTPSPPSPPSPPPLPPPLLLSLPGLSLSTQQRGYTHLWERFEKRGYCIQCKKDAANWEPKRTRPVLSEIVNGATITQAQRQSRAPGGCKICSVHLCVKEACFERYHSNNNNK